MNVNVSLKIHLSIEYYIILINYRCLTFFELSNKHTAWIFHTVENSSK